MKYGDCVDYGLERNRLNFRGLCLGLEVQIRINATAAG